MLHLILNIVCEPLQSAKQPRKKVTVSLLPTLPPDNKWLCQAVISHHVVVMMLSTEARLVIVPQCLPYESCLSTSNSMLGKKSVTRREPQSRTVWTTAATQFESCKQLHFIKRLWSCVCVWQGWGGSVGGGGVISWWWARQWDDSYLELPSYSQELFSLDSKTEYSVHVWISLREQGFVGAA